MNTILVDDIDNESNPGDIEKLKKDLSEATAQSHSAELQKEEDALPDKYRGKSLEDVVEMHRNAESELGRRSNELGQYKKLTDELLDLKRRDDLVKGGAKPEEPEEEPLPEISSTDLLDNPSQALSKVLDARDQRNEQRRKRQELQQHEQEVQAKFVEAHPDAEQIVNDPAFVKWVSESTARSLLGYQAANGDLIAGDALLNEWKSSHKPQEGTSEVKEDRLAAARKAATESAGQSSTPDAPKGKVYRRLDLIRLKLEDPEAYADESFQNEIIRAYAEGRVK